MLSEDEKEAIKLLEDIKNNSWTTKYIMSSDSKNADILLNLITKQQKGNEDLLREKEENKFIIAMANNEMLGYNQGYLDAKNQNSNATEIVMKNRQAYMHKEEVEFYKRKIDFLQKENEEKDKQIDLMTEIFYKRFKAELLLEYGFENEEQLKQYFVELVEKE